MSSQIFALRHTSAVPNGSLCHLSHQLAVGNVHTAENLEEKKMSMTALVSRSLLNAHKTHNVL